MISKYRKDSRTNKQFKNDIEDSSLLERLLIRIVAADLSRISRSPWLFIDNGCDNYGKVLDDSKISTDADFQLICPDGNFHKVDIKYSRPDRKSFHLKKHQLVSYKKQNCIIIMFMGLNTPNMRYTLIYPSAYDKILKGKSKILWDKEQYELFCKDFEWHNV